MGKTMKKFSNRELSDFSGQLAMILNAGMSLTEGLTMMEEDAEKAEEKQILTALLQGIEESGSFAQALEQALVFPDYMVKMVNLGQESGHLDDVMMALSDHYDREDSLSKGIRSAVAYPIMLLAMMAIIVVVLLTRVMPIFNQVFLQLGTELSGFSRGLMNLGQGIRSYGAVLGALIAVLVITGVWMGRSRQGKEVFHRLGRKIPWIRNVYDRVSVCRFSSGMALALSSGLNPEYALELVEDLIQTPDFKSRLIKCREALGQGEDFSQVLLHAGIFTGVYARMAAIAEKTGSMPETMDRIARDAQEQLDQKISGALAMIEPTLVVLLSIVVGAILMSVMFPLLGIMSSL